VRAREGSLRDGRRLIAGTSPNEQAALKVLYLVVTGRRKNRSNPTGRVHGSKQILNALTIHYGDRITAAT
jgi:hypothetical protein